MGRLFVITGLALTLAACAGSPTEKRWSCSPTKGLFRSCASIGEIDARSSPVRPAGSASVTFQSLTGGALAEGGVGQGTPQRDTDQVLRIVVAPWIDAADDYHARSEIFAVVRRGGWSLAVPPPPAPPPAAEGGAE